MRPARHFEFETPVLGRTPKQNVIDVLYGQAHGTLLTYRQQSKEKFNSKFSKFSKPKSVKRSVEKKNSIQSLVQQLRKNFFFVTIAEI